ncbi:MAG: ribosome recycling factor, partial [Clostridiales bacterium]|nr:ribosome recycling factor [Clostridiales bacterium]
GRVAIRNIRREALDKYRGHLKKKEITEDSLGIFETELQKLTDKYIAEIDKVSADKEKDLMEL